MVGARRCDTPGKKYVYDLKNCGPRNRFVSFGTTPVVVHNCTQGLSSDIIRHQMRMIVKRFRQDFGLAPDNIVLQVHDEIVAIVPEGVAEDVLSVMIEEVSRTPDWATGLVLNAEGSIADRYGEAK